MSEWGRKEYSKAWPSRTPVWTWTATLPSLAFFVGMLTLKYEVSWTAAERLYLKHTMGEARLPEIRAEFGRRVEASELIEVARLGARSQLARCKATSAS